MREWKLVSNWGMARDEDPEDIEGPFYAGILVDALRLKLPPYNPLLVASNSSGVWRVDEAGGPAIPLSFNWNPPGLNCLARGFYREEHVYAGGAALYETDVNTVAPLAQMDADQPAPSTWSAGEHRRHLPDGRCDAEGRVGPGDQHRHLVGADPRDSRRHVYTVTQAPLLPGLPLMPYSMDLRTTIESSRAAFVYLATWGWSAFRLLTNLDDTEQTVIIDGHMDIVDRQPVGDDIWGHSKFTRIAKLGPLHPFEEYSINGDNGDEVRVELKIKCAWKSNKSVEVRYSATLIDMGSGDEVTDTEGETLRIVVSGTTQTIAFDMDSDEWWPDRAHVEFTVQN